MESPRDSRLKTNGQDVDGSESGNVPPGSMLKNPVFQVITTSLWLAIPQITLAISPDAAAWANQMLRHEYCSSYLEILLAGGVPVLFILIGKEKWSRYGLNSQGLVKGLLWSALVVALGLGCNRLTTGRWLEFHALASRLGYPARVYYAFLGVFAYGPLEMFFVVWLVRNTGLVFQNVRNGPIWGLTITALYFGLLHLIYGFNPALQVGVSVFLLGLIFLRTGSGIGPMIAWSLLDMQVWRLASLLWS